MTPIYSGPTEWMADVDLLVRSDATLTQSCKADLQAAMMLNPLPRIIGSVERLYIEKANNAGMSAEAKSVMGATAQQVYAWKLGLNGKPGAQSENGRAYDIWQLEKARQGDSDADTTVTAPLPLAAWNDLTMATVPFPPTVTGISPASAPSSGNTNLTLTGTSLETVTDVTIGGTAAKFVGLSDTEITVVAQGGAAGEADIVVTTAGGPSAPFKGFSYAAPAAGGG